VGGKVMDVGNDMASTFKDAAGKAGDKFSDFYDAAQEDAAKEAGDLKGDMVDKASDMVNNQDMDGTVDAAKGLGDKIETAADRANNMFPNEPIKNDDSLLDGHDSFFDKAQKYADGDYSGDGNKSGDMKIIENPEINEEDLFANHDPSTTIPGFEDVDGDGDPLIDDAEIES